MMRYRNETKRMVSAAMGVLVTRSSRILDGLLDEGIVKLASRTLTYAQFQAFFYAYRCEPSWERIRDLYRTELGRKLKIYTIRRSAQEAQKTLSVKCVSAPELESWYQEYTKGNQWDN